MKILFFSRLFYPHVGGVETHVLEISSELIKLGHEVTIITERYEENLPENSKYKEIQIYRIPVYDATKKEKKFVIWEWLIANRHIIKQANIIHVHDVAYWLFPIFFFNKNTYITFHGYEAGQLPTRKAILMRKIGQKIAKKTIEVGDFIQKWYGTSPNRVIYGATRTIASQRKTKQLIYLGRVSHDMGIMIYLQALKNAQKLGFKISLVMYGDGPLYEEVARFSKKNRLAVNLKGFKKNASLNIGKYKYAFVSGYLAILEAMRAKVPVLAVYNNQIKKDYLDCHPMRENFFATNDPKKLAVQLIKLQKPDAETKAQVERAYQWAKKQTWEALTKVYLNLWGI